MSDSFKKLTLIDIFRSVGTWQVKFVKLCDYVLSSLIVCFISNPKSSQEISSSEISKLLIIRPGGIGDAVFLLPFIRIIKKNNPNLVIDVLCERRNRAVFDSQHHLFKSIYSYDQFKDFKLVFKNAYDVIIDTEQWHFLSAIVARCISSQVRIGFASRKEREKCFSQGVEYKINAHELENFRKLFNVLFKEVEGVNSLESSFIISDDGLQWAKNRIKEKSVCVFLGSSIVIRRFSIKQAQEIIDSLLANKKRVLLLGGNDVLETALELERIYKGKSVENFVGKCSLIQSAALIKFSELFVGPDSGLMHLACAVGTPVMAIFGPGNLQKWRPSGKNDRVVSNHMPCSPCTHFGYTIPTCGGRFECVGKIDYGKV